MKKLITIGLIFSLLLTVSVTALDFIPSFFGDLIDIEVKEEGYINFITPDEFSREGWYDGESFDGDINRFDVSILASKDEMEVGQSTTALVYITNLEATSGEMWIQCSVLSVTENPR